MGGFEEIEAGLGIRGRFVLDSVIAEGGMSTVYRATQLSLDRPVALKVMKRTPGWQADLEQRFLAEAQLAARIAHPNVVRVLEPGAGPLGLYIAYELVEGRSLREAMARRMKPARALHLVLQAAAGLGAVHDAGAVHRDVKPENLLVDLQGTLRLTDLGIAKDFSGEVMTRTGVIFGTPAYMSPEHCRGEPVDATSDLYSLGIVAYELLTGSTPFRRDGPARLLDAHLREAPEAPSTRNPALPPAWDGPLLKALEKDPRRRYRSAREMSEALDWLLLEAEDSSAVRPAPSRSGTPSKSQITVSAELARPALPSSATLISGRTTVGGQSTTGGLRWGLGLVAAALAIGLAWWGLGAPERTGETGGTPGPRADASAGAVAAASATAAAVSSAPATVTSPPRPARDPLLDGVIASLRSACTISPPLEPHPAPPPGPPGSSSYLSRLFLVEVRTMRAPRLRLSVEGTPAATTAAPRLFLETGSSGLALTAGREPSDGGRHVWTAGLDLGRLHDGMNRVHVELPGSAPSSPPRLALEFERAADFPASSPAEPRTVCPTCCPEDAAIAAIWNLYDHGHLFRARKESAELAQRWPRCGPLLIVQSYTDFRISLERRTVGELTLSFSMTVLGDEAESLPPDWKLRDEAGGRLEQLMRLYPGWSSPYYRFSRAMQAVHNWEVALRAARYAVVVQPANGSNWMELAETERCLLEGRPADRALAGFTGSPELALAHAERCVKLLDAKPASEARELLTQAKLMVLAGRREAARAVLQTLLAGKPEMREARMLLATLGPSRGGS